MREQEQETQEITSEDTGDLEDILGPDGSEPELAAEDCLRFDIVVPSIDPSSHEGRCTQALADQIREAIVAVVESKTNWKFRGSEVHNGEDEEIHEAPLRTEQLDFWEK
jgi:hypothetical protein